MEEIKSTANDSIDPCASQCLSTPECTWYTTETITEYAGQDCKGDDNGDKSVEEVTTEAPDGTDETTTPTESRKKRHVTNGSKNYRCFYFSYCTLTEGTQLAARKVSISDDLIQISYHHFLIHLYE